MAKLRYKDAMRLKPKIVKMGQSQLVKRIK